MQICLNLLCYWDTLSITKTKSFNPLVKGFLYSDEILDHLEKTDFDCVRLFYFKKETMTFSSFIKTHRETHLSKC